MSSSSISPQRTALIQKAVEEWRKRLVDLTGRNRLIYFRSIKGSLDLSDASIAAVEALLAGRSVKLEDLVRLPGLDRDAQTRVTTDALQRGRLIHSTAQTNYEERGIRTLHLAYGSATWVAGDTSTATPNAPVVLAPLSMMASGSSQRDFVISRVGPWEVNQTLLIFWQEVFGVQVSATEIEELELSAQDDPAAMVEATLRLVSTQGRIASLDVRPMQLIGNFAYQKMPMVKDLESAIAELAKNDLLAAIAGDPAATTAVRERNGIADIDESQPNTVPLANEFLILDADSSQSFAINAALAGRSLVIKGPPGTGKSQTIANLIASLAAQGKSTLFVAEKRAAIEAVLKRLEGAGLGSLALDLHSSVLNRKSTALSLAESLQELAAVGRPDVADGHARLTTSRSRLVEYERELHTVREPWRLSSFDVNTRLLAHDLDVNPAPLDADVINGLDTDTQNRMADLLRRWASTRRIVDWNSPWLDAPIESPRSAEALIATATALHRSTLPELDSSIGRLGDDTGCDLDAANLANVHAVASAAEAVAATLDAFERGIWDVDAGRLADELDEKSLLSFLDGDYRAAKKTAKGLARHGQKGDELVAALRIAQGASHAWRATGSNRPPTPSSVSARVVELLGELQERLTTIFPEVADEFGSIELDPLVEDVRYLAQTDDAAIIIGQMMGQRSELIALGLQPVVSAVEDGEVDEDDVATVFEFTCLDGIRKAIDQRNPVLNTFRPEEQGRIADEFAAGDRWHRDAAAARVHRAVAEHAIAARNAHPDQSALIEKEAKKKTRHKSLRQLQTQAGDVLQSLRPCWMMSPLMVAQTLPAVACFDYVIFDEASQIRPEEAISAILRGRTLIVAGDEKQLPPSAFFSSSAESGEEEYDEDEVDALTSNYESILDVTAALLPSRMLTWHYRSKDERLIKLSNDHVYDRHLVTFPGAVRDTPITFHKIDHIPTLAVETRSNQREVAAVVDLMIEHARTRPDETLGVIAFGQHHASAIEGALRDRLEAEPDEGLEEFFAEDRPERVFVKNIERVQGDERDAIILSVGYGKDPSGNVPHRFGPVNTAGGERRINVAASRARARMAIVSSIAHTDLRTDGLGKGPKLMEEMLRFAASGGADTGHAGTTVPLNAFESAVKTELERLGLQPIPQYGSSNFRIDFVLPHPDNDGRMVLAIEADGASYHSSPTARDRDRLRQQMLERLGWQFHRIWSTAFFRDPQGEAAKVLDAYEACLRGEQVATPRPQPFAPVSGSAPPSSGPGRPKPRFPKGLPIAEHDHRKLVALAQWISDNGNGLLTDDQIKEEMKATLGYSRQGAKIAEAFDRALRNIKR